MKSEYYTPSIEDFMQGLEFEYNEFSEEDYEYTNIWIKAEFDSRCGLGNELKHVLNEGQVRVKYLNQEDIESLGFKKSWTTIDRYNSLDYGFIIFNSSDLLR